jgi:CheY-like chemotaxis protein
MSLRGLRTCELLGWLRETLEFSALKVVVWTGSDDHRAITRVLAAGANRVVRKPWDREGLANRWGKWRVKWRRVKRRERESLEREGKARRRRDEGSPGVLDRALFLLGILFRLRGVNPSGVWEAILRHASDAS